MDTTSATSANNVAHNDHMALRTNDAPCAATRCGNRRLATNATIIGDMTSATASKDTMTMIGVTPKITIKGASTDLSRLAPMPSSHAQALLRNADDFIIRITWSMAGSQKK